MSGQWGGAKQDSPRDSSALAERMVSDAAALERRETGLSCAVGRLVDEPLGSEAALELGRERVPRGADELADDRVHDQAHDAAGH